MCVLRCLGQFHLECNQQPIALPTRKTAALLAYLVLHPEVHDRERLVTRFWGDFGEEQARRSLRTALSALRKALGEDALLADRETVQFNPNFPVWVDALTLCRQIQQFLEQQVVNPSLVDLALYQGDLLDGFYDEWILRQREELRFSYLRTLLRLAQHWRTQGDYARTSEMAQWVLALEPAEETAHQHLLFCYTATGNRQAARQQYEACVRALRDELDVEPTPETVALYRRSQQGLARNPSPAATHTNLPLPVASFIGRVQEIAKLKGLLLGDQAAAQRSAVRLVTVTGPGGCGKTRLAIQVGHDLLDAYAEGVWWVELAALSEESQVAQAVAKVLDIQQGRQASLTDVLVTNLRGKQALLVLDNCEHLVTACAELAERLLRHCPDLQILATSREALGILGETSWLVPSLTLPGPDLSAFAKADRSIELLQFEGIRLFVERASAVQRNFALTAANGSAILQICRQLDGIPLAIELAAARIKLMTVEQLSTRLTSAIGARFELLIDGSRTVLLRQQTLRATMAWSYALLGEQEQRLLQQFSIFAGGWSLEAAEAAGAASGEQLVATILARLVDKSLILVESQGEVARYQMLETVRQYTYEQLEKGGGIVAARDRHLGYFLQLAEQAAQRLRSPDQAEWLARLAVEHDNLRSALAWTLTSQQPNCGARLGAALWRFWYTRGYYEEGWQWLERLLTLVDQAEQQANLRYGQGMLARRRGDSAAAIDALAASLVLYRQLGDPRGVASALRGLGFVYHFRGDFDRARPPLEEALTLFRRLDDQEGIAVTLDNLAYIANDWAKTQSLYQESLTLRRRSGNLHGITTSLAGLAYCAINQSDYAAARRYLQEHLQINEELGNQNGIANGLLILGRVAFDEGDYKEAEVLYKKSLEICQESGDRSLLPGVLCGLGTIALKRRAYAEAHTLLEQSLSSYYAAGAYPGIPTMLGYLASLAVAQGQAQRALSLAGANAALCAALRLDNLSSDQAEFAHIETLARQRLNEVDAATAWAMGQAMTLEQAVTYALAK